MKRNGKYLFTSESVGEGHPDKVADQISDSVLDAIFAKDPKAHVDCETLVMQGTVIVTGQITTAATVNIPTIVRQTLKEIGFDNAKDGLDWETCGILVSLTEQSPDIARGVIESEGHEQGAGDQGMVFGYATNETKELMPLPILLAQKLVKRLAYCRKNNIMPYLRPDCKSQVTVEYEGGKPQKIKTVVIAAQNNGLVEDTLLKKDVIEKVIKQVIPADLLAEDVKYVINGTGRFVIGGTLADSGLTGRKIIVDTYGGVGSHGGGCFSGKDPSKVDRSGCYMARYIAKNVVASGLAEQCEVQISYAIGIAEPISVLVNTYETGKLPDEKILELVKKNFDMRPKAIIDQLNLLRPIYKKTAVFGHFGRDDVEFPWERTDKAEILKKELEKAQKA
ncbi:MAG: methionine adenosyltransferase [Candidatus Bathyarchaeia archaeon]|nr:methionine adenosyltransferase [Candidatus Bathyarchaeota archaeon]MDI9577976.1 methionine adenosyltransferase [Thermoproteota archaeon]MDT8783071.1 methionine adenosyltransferase [Candidatus Bathyarchaeota archaeon]NLD65774.1 methionine adenosyltransferase [Thermoproteota archaeon]